jgi:hypothetical protein
LEYGPLVTVICLRAEWSKVNGETLPEGLEDTENVGFNVTD